jgi:hypothetical protein
MRNKKFWEGKVPTVGRAGSLKFVRLKGNDIFIFYCFWNLCFLFECLWAPQ